MNKKAGINEIVMNNFVYFIIVILFIIGLWVFVSGQMNGAAVWEDFYAKEITRVVNLAEPGQEIELDVHRGSEIGKKNEVPFSEMFRFNSVENEICVRLSESRRSCYNYFNDVSVVESELVLIGNDAGDKNILKFRIVERERNV